MGADAISGASYLADFFSEWPSKGTVAQQVQRTLQHFARTLVAYLHCRPLLCHLFVPLGVAATPCASQAVLTVQIFAAAIDYSVFSFCASEPAVLTLQCVLAPLPRPSAAVRALQGTTWDAEGYRRSFSYIPRLGLPVVDLLAPMPGKPTAGTPGGALQ